MLKSPRKMSIFLPSRYCKQLMNSDNGDFGDLYINEIEIGVLLNCCFFRVIIEMALKSSFDKIIISLEYPFAILLHLFIFELKCILNYLSKADSIMQVSLFISSRVSSKHNMSLSDKCFPLKCP